MDQYKPYECFQIVAEDKDFWHKIIMIDEADFQSKGIFYQICFNKTVTHHKPHYNRFCALYRIQITIFDPGSLNQSIDIIIQKYNDIRTFKKQILSYLKIYKSIFIFIYQFN